MKAITAPVTTPEQSIRMGTRFSTKNEHAANRFDEAKQHIRSAGLRATPARIATLVLLRETTTPMTHAEVAQQIATTGFDKATAFRNLNDLSEVGLLRKSELGDHVWRFEAIDPAHGGERGHPHFLCIDCGSVTCLDDVQLTAGSRRQSENVGEVTEILLRGHCNECR